MQDRGYIKWSPFNSLFNDEKIKNEVNSKREKVIKPILSYDQIEYLNEKIFDAYTNHYKVVLYIYKNESIVKLDGFINNINIDKKTITFNNNHIFFNQITRINDFL